jgi:hypothetical protein
MIQVAEMPGEFLSVMPVFQEVRKSVMQYRTL